jgi:hypothetical protein
MYPLSDNFFRLYQIEVPKMHFSLTSWREENRWNPKDFGRIRRHQEGNENNKEQFLDTLISLLF